MIVGSKHNQPKARPKGKKKQQPEGTKFPYLSVQEKKNNLSITDHNQKPTHNKHTVPPTI